MDNNRLSFGAIVKNLSISASMSLARPATGKVIQEIMEIMIDERNRHEGKLRAKYTLVNYTNPFNATLQVLGIAHRYLSGSWILRERGSVEDGLNLETPYSEIEVVYRSQIDAPPIKPADGSKLLLDLHLLTDLIPRSVQRITELG